MTVPFLSDFRVHINIRVFWLSISQTDDQKFACPNARHWNFLLISVTVLWAESSIFKNADFVYVLPNLMLLQYSHLRQNQAHQR